MEDSIEMINRKPKPLAAYLFSDDEQLKTKFVQNVSAGGMAINDTVRHVIPHSLKFIGKAMAMILFIGALFYLTVLQNHGIAIQLNRTSPKNFSIHNISSVIE